MSRDLPVLVWGRYLEDSALRNLRKDLILELVVQEGPFRILGNKTEVGPIDQDFLSSYNFENV